jgi:hypothetical protein
MKKLIATLSVLAFVCSLAVATGCKKDEPETPTKPDTEQPEDGNGE